RQPERRPLPSPRRSAHLRRQALLGWEMGASAHQGPRSTPGPSGRTGQGNAGSAAGGGAVVTSILDRLRPSLTPQWIEPPPVPDGTDLASLHPSPLLARILWTRGIEDEATAKAFTSSRTVAAPSPWLLPNMDAAVERVSAAIDNREKVAIFGDYDADG